MTVYQDVVNIAAVFCLPIAPQVYTGVADSYMVIDVNVGDVVAGDDEPVYAYYQVTLSLYTPIRADTVELCKQLQTAIYNAGFSFPALDPGIISLDGARKCQTLTFGRWDEWQ